MLKRILIASGYVVLALALAVGTFALVAYGNDYSYDFATHKVIQNGHVILNSLPGGVKVTADGKELKKKTPYQAAYKVGLHTFSLAKDGYYTWQKTLKVVAGQVTLARYVVLVPQKPKSDTLDTRAQVVAESISKDHRHIAYITGANDPGVYTLDVGNPKPVKLYTPAPANEAGPAEVLTDVTWSDDASHLLLVSTLNGASVHRVVAANGGEPENLTTRYAFNFSGAKFSAATWKQLYWISPEGLRRVDIDAETISGVLASKVQQFWVQPDRVLYVQQTDLGRSLWSLDNRGHHQELIQALPESDAYSVAYVNYRGDDQLAVVPAKTQTATLYTGIFGSTPVAQVIAHDVTTASFSPDGHFLVLYAPTRMVTYDLEQSLVFKRLISYTVTDQPGNLLALSWFDNHHLLANRDGKLYWSEYDGANRVEIGPAYGALPAYSTSDTRSIITYRPDGQTVKVLELLIKQ